MVTAIIFILILSGLVLVHEWGHFFTARMFGMKVHEFGIGFPPRAGGFYKDPKTGKWKWVSGKGKNTLAETVGGEDRAHPDEFPNVLYSLNWLPLGGFVKIKGENGEEAADKDSFGHYPAWKKLTVLLAGVVMNFILAAVLLGIGFIQGLPADSSALEDKHAIVVEAPAVMIQNIEADSPAEIAGLSFGDKILKLNGVDVVDSTSLVAFVQENGPETMNVLIDRVGVEQELELTPMVLHEGEFPRIGVSLADAGIVKYPWYIAIFKGFQAAWFSLINIFVSFYILIKGFILGQGAAFGVAGPVGIAVVVGQSAKLGMSYLLNVTAMISLSLAAINVLPIPALDGGRALFVIIEKLTGKPVPMKYEQIAHTIGFLALILLIIVVTFKDIVKLF